MGCDLEDVLRDFKEFKDMALYWFNCRSFEYKELNEKLDSLEQFLREKNEQEQ